MKVNYDGVWTPAKGRRAGGSGGGLGVSNSPRHTTPPCTYLRLSSTRTISTECRRNRLPRPRQRAFAIASMRRGHLPVRTPAHTAREVLCVEPLTAFREEHQCMDLGSRLPPKRPLFCTFFWSPSDVPGDPPNPLSTGLASGSNIPVRDFLYRQEVVWCTSSTRTRGR